MATLDKVNLVTREIELTKLLASNDPKTRSDGIKQMKQLLLKYSGDTTDGLSCLLTLFYIPNSNVLCWPCLYS